MVHPRRKAVPSSRGFGVTFLHSSAPRILLLYPSLLLPTFLFWISCYRAAMARTGLPPLLLALLAAAPPLGLSADDCLSPATSNVLLSASSYRNATGHWITKASLTRRSSSDVSNVLHGERPLQFDVDITRRSCGDAETLTTTFNVVAPPARVGSDYKFFPGVGYYKLHTDNMTWEEALRTCAREGAHLAVVNSEAEENAIREVMRAHSQDNFPAFIGFHDRFKEGDYVTVLGDPLSSTGHVRWSKGEPNNVVTTDSPEGQDCGNIYTAGTINDGWCGRKQPFVCEQGL